MKYASSLDTDVPLLPPIQFEDIELNAGDAYSLTTGLFTAPVDGLYMFALHVCCRCSDSVELCGFGFLSYNISLGGGVALRNDDKTICATGFGLGKLKAGTEVSTLTISIEIDEQFSDWNYFTGALLRENI